MARDVYVTDKELLHDFLEGAKETGDTVVVPPGWLHSVPMEIPAGVTVRERYSTVHVIKGPATLPFPIPADG